MSLGDGELLVRDRLKAWDAADYTSRFWRKDPTVWSPEPMPEIEDRLGWLDLPRSMHELLRDIDSFRKDIHKANLTHAVLLGMGGSSLAPEVFQRTFGNRKGYPELIVLDSTHPTAVLDVDRRIDPARTLFIVSSKSGTTTETLSFFKYFWHKVQGVTATPGRHFVAITDPGTPLERLAGERGFRYVFQAPSDVGGRYSALSVFGIVPAAVIGVNVHQILDGGWAMTENTGPSVPTRENPALWLGATMGEMARVGRDKLTITTSPTISAFPDWIEQLVAESTGKNDKGILPVAGEPLGPPDVYGTDRLFVHISVRGRVSVDEEVLYQLERAGHPVARIQITDKILLGQEFFRWEFAVAAAGSVMGIHPFNQPDVQLAKELAKKKMDDEESRGATGWGDGINTLSTDEPDTRAALESWLGSSKPGDYVAIQAYLPPSERSTAALQAFRIALRDRLRLATTLGYGPRFLHSTGQLHKGGPNTGLFIQIVDAVSENVAVPETDYTFGDLVRAQAMGDAQALMSRGRRILRLDIGGNGPDGLSGLIKLV